MTNAEFLESLRWLALIAGILAVFWLAQKVL